MEHHFFPSIRQWNSTKERFIFFYRASHGVMLSASTASLHHSFSSSVFLSSLVSACFGDSFEFWNLNTIQKVKLSFAYYQGFMALLWIQIDKAKSFTPHNKMDQPISPQALTFKACKMYWNISRLTIVV